jgi:hypothetical protein
MKPQTCLKLAFLLTATAFAGWSQTGTIAGTVLDSTSSGVPGAEISATNVGTGLVRTASTDTSGTYSLPNLPAGTYNLAIGKTGFQTLRFENVALTVAQVLTLNGTIVPAKVSTQVDVVGQVAPAIDLETAQLSNIVDQRRIQDLPLLTRDAYSLVLLSPGVEQTNSGLGGFSFNGQRERNNNFLLDGVDNNDASVPGIPGGVASANPDSVQEFRVITNNFLPEYGRNTGAIVDLITKSGTNTFHGSAYEFNRVNALAARDFFNPTPQQQNPFVRNEFGFSTGGPIWKNHTFFFVNSEWQRFVTTLSDQAAVPTPEFKTGVFSYNGEQINLAKPSSPNNALGLPLDPSMQKILGHYPNPNGPAINPVEAIYFFPSASRTDGATVASRIDHRFNDKYSIFLRYNYGGASDPDPFHDEQLPGIGATGTNQVSNSGTANFTAVFRPNLVNEARFGLNRTDDLFTCGGHNIIDQFSPLDSYGFGQDYSFKTSNSVPTIADFACEALSGSNGQFRRAGTWHYVDNLSWIHGKHDIKVGAEFRNVFENGYDASGSRSLYSFSVFGNFGVNVVNCSVCGDDEIIQTLGAALLGYGFQQQTQYFNAGGERTATDFRKFRQHEYAEFFQDIWKIRSNLTLELGVRYQFNGVPYETSGDLSTLFENPSGPAPLAFSTVGPGTGRQLYANDWGNIEPRLGLSWDPTGTGKTAIRAGFGVFHDRTFGNLFTNLKANPPFTANALEGFFTVASATPPPTQPSPTNLAQDGDFNQTASLIDPNLKMPYTQAWNLGIQQALGWGSSIELNYVGSSSHRLFRSVDGNPPQPFLVDALIASGVPASDLQGGALRFATYGQVTGNTAFVEPILIKSIGNATYNGLHAVFNKTLSRGLQFQAAYAWSHAIDDAPDPLVATAANRNIARNSFNLKEERGSSDFDLRHRLVLNFLYELPFGTGHAMANHGILNIIAGNWQVSGISTFESGRPFDVFSPVDVEHTGLSSRPDLVGDPSIPPGSDITQTGPPASAFASAPFGRPGTVGRNTFTGPTYFNTDVDLLKRFRLTERANLQFRAEFYNVFNKVQLSQPGILGQGQPGNVITDPGTFGVSLSTLTRPDGTSSARQIQLALKLQF